MKYTPVVTDNKAPSKWTLVQFYGYKDVALKASKLFGLRTNGTKDGDTGNIQIVFEGDKNGIIEGDADCMNIQVPNIEILKEGNIYRIKWSDDGKGNVRRRGGNEDFRKKGAKLSGYPNVLNETAFVLENGQSGIVRWNNRFSSYHGQWYEQYQVFFVNTVTLDSKVFIRDYDF